MADATPIPNDADRGGPSPAAREDPRTFAVWCGPLLVRRFCGDDEDGSVVARTLIDGDQRLTEIDLRALATVAAAAADQLAEERHAAGEYDRAAAQQRASLETVMGSLPEMGQAMVEAMYGPAPGKPKGRGKLVPIKNEKPEPLEPLQPGERIIGGEVCVPLRFGKDGELEAALPDSPPTTDQ